MNMTESNRTSQIFNEIRNLIDRGDYLSANQSIQMAVKDLRLHEINAAPLMIEIGVGLNDIGIIEAAINILKKWLGKIQDKRSQVIINYDLAKGFMDLYVQHVKAKKLGVTAIPGNETLQTAKKYFRQAVNQIAFAEKSEQPKILTDYGNCLDDLGRSLEALKVYDEALEVAPGFKMALGNKAIAIRRFAYVAGKFRTAIYIEAHQILKSIIDDPEIIKTGTMIANDRFKREMNEIESIFPDKSVLNTDLRHKRYSDDGLSDFEKFYLNFCTKNNLFLHLHILDNTCKAAITDSVFISILEPKGENARFLELSKIINQIKEDFMIGRLLLVESLYRRDEYDRISERTTLVNAKDNLVFHIYAGLLKAAYRLTYNILDKIAGFINNYFGLEIDEGRVYFIKMWEHERKIKESLLNTKNISLYALYDVYLDLKKDGYFERLKLIRNSLVHRKLILYGGEKRSYDDDKDCDSIGWEAMVKRTIEMMYLIKSAIIYMINCVQIEEMRKADKLKGAIITHIEPDTTQELENK